jgi:membrane protein
MLLKRLKTAGAYWVEDQAAQMGAAVAYYALFSIAPLLIIVSAIAGQAYGTQAAREHMIAWIRHSISEESAAAVQSLLDNCRQPPDGVGPWLVGLGALIFGAVGVFTQLRASLHRIWRVKAPPAQGMVSGYIKSYLLAILMLLVSSVFFLLMIVESMVPPLLFQEGGEMSIGENWRWRLVDFGASSFLILLLMAFTYRFMSDGTVRYRYIWGGAFINAVLFTIGKMAIGFYLAHSQVTSGFGPAGSLVVLLIWVYYCAQIFFFGAEVIRVRLNK